LVSGILPRCESESLVREIDKEETTNMFINMKITEKRKPEKEEDWND
jgi:hypothetical protein